MSDIYYEKYLKYKNKYLGLKFESRGAGECSDNLKDYPEKLGFTFTIKNKSGKDITFDAISGKDFDIKTSTLNRDGKVVVSGNKDDYDKIIDEHYWGIFNEMFKDFFEFKRIKKVDKGDVKSTNPAERAKYVEDRIKKEMTKLMNQYNGQFEATQKYLDIFNLKTSGGGSVGKFDPKKVLFPEYFKDEKFVRDFVKEVKDLYLKKNGIDCLNQKIKQFLIDTENDGAKSPLTEEINDHKESIKKSEKEKKKAADNLKFYEQRIVNLNAANDKLIAEHNKSFVTRSQKKLEKLLQELNENKAVGDDFKPDALKKFDQIQKKIKEKDLPSLEKDKKNAQEKIKELDKSINYNKEEISKKENEKKKKAKESGPKKDKFMERYKKLRYEANVSIKAAYWFLFRKYIDDNRLITFPFGWTFSGRWIKFHKNSYNLFYNLVYNLSTDRPRGRPSSSLRGDGDSGISECTGNCDSEQIWAAGFECLDSDHKEILKITNGKSDAWKKATAEFNSKGELIHKSWEYDSVTNEEGDYAILKKLNQSTPPITSRRSRESKHLKDTCDTASQNSGKKK